MSDQEYVKSLIKEAELYRKQGLLRQAQGIYSKVSEYVKKSGSLSGRNDLIDAIKSRLTQIEAQLAELQDKEEAPELSAREHDLISKLFAFSGNEKTAAMEGALALAKFGQYEPALAEFNKILKAGVMPVAAAKNVLRCHLALSSPNEAIDQYERWMTNNTLTEEQLNNVRSFLMGLLKKKGIMVNLPEVRNTKQESPPRSAKGTSEGDVLDISSVGLRLTKGPEKGKQNEFEVTFQSGNIISIVIAADKKTLLDSFNIGIELPDMQFYSPIAIFRGKGVVSGKTEIKSGPKKGDYMLDIRVESG